MDLATEIRALIAANVPMVHLVTYEEERIIRTLLELPAARDMGIIVWDMADGFTEMRRGTQPFTLEDKPTPEAALQFIAQKAPTNQIFVLRDFHHAWRTKPAYVTRKLRNLAPKLRGKGQYLFFITPEPGLPAELKDDVVVLHVPYPDADDLNRLFDQIKRERDPDGRLRPEVKGKLVSSALGLTTSQARVAFSRVYAQYNRFDERGIDLVTWAKRDIIRESGALEYWPAEEGEHDVGGLDLMKAWLSKRGGAFSDSAREHKLPYPKGAMLTGIPGTGKSLSVKMLSGLWKMPLLRLDVGTLFGSLLGESEANLRKAMSLAEAVSPCILWIDEIEKAFAGTDTKSINAGSSTRVFGSFLTWMQERRTPVFVAATANDISGLPVELMSRFDRTFFLELPNAAERRQIFLIHLRNAGAEFPETNPAFHIEELVSVSKGYVGREIARAVVEGQFTAFADGGRPIEQRDIIGALKEVVPISRSHAEPLKAISKWVEEGRAFPASSPEQQTAQNTGRVITV